MIITRGKAAPADAALGILPPKIISPLLAERGKGWGEESNNSLICGNRLLLPFRLKMETVRDEMKTTGALRKSATELGHRCRRGAEGKHGSDV